MTTFFSHNASPTDIVGGQRANFILWQASSEQWFQANHVSFILLRLFFLFRDADKRREREDQKHNTHAQRV